MVCMDPSLSDDIMKDILSSSQNYRLAIAMVSNELESSMSAVRGYSDIIREELSGSERPRAIEMAGKISDLAILMSETMDIARTLIEIKEGNVGKEYRRMDLSSMLRHCVKLVDGTNHDIRLGTGEGDFQITCHPLLRRTFLNIIDNAIRRSPSGSRIDIEITADLGGTTISIADEGEGVPTELREVIFDSISRSSVYGAIQGSGLGLAVSRGIVELHNGRIWVEDNRPKGAVFKVFLPWDPHHSDRTP